MWHNRKFQVLLLMVLSLAVAVSSRDMKKEMNDHIDISVDPCEDFSSYVCGKWMNNTKLPSHRSQLSAAHVLNNEVSAQVREFITTMPNQSDPISLLKVKKFYRKCMDTSTINKAGVKPLLQSLKEMHFRRKYEVNWQIFLYKLANFGGSENDFLPKLVMRDMEIPKKKLLYIFGSKLFLKNKNLYIGENKKNKAYRQLIYESMQLIGYSQNTSSQIADNAYKFEVELANITIGGYRSIYTHFYRIEYDDLMKDVNIIDWDRYFKAAFGVKLNISQIGSSLPRSYFQSLNELLSLTPNKNINDYLLVRYVISSLGLLGNKSSSIYLKFKKQAYGSGKQNERKKFCYKLTYSSELTPVLGHYYVKKYFNGNSKSEVNNVIQNLLIPKARSMVENMNWMTPESRNKSLIKMDKMRTIIGYPDEMLNTTIIDDYLKDFIPKDESFFYLKKKLDRLEFKNYIRLFNDHSEWLHFKTPHYVDAYYEPTGNYFAIFAAIMQGNFYDAKRELPFNLGALYYIVGHEIFHAFDTIGNAYNENGVKTSWWDNKTKENFSDTVDCYADSYSRMEYPGTNITFDGRFVSLETVADNGGLTLSDLVLKEQLKKDPSMESRLLKKYGKSAAQLMYISYGMTLCEVGKLSYFKDKSVNPRSPHPPGFLRINGAAINQKSFGEAFNCTAGQRMVSQQKRCSLV